MSARSAVTFRDLTGLITLLKTALGALALVTLAVAWSSWLQIDLLSQAQQGGEITQEAAAIDDQREEWVGAIYLVVYVATAILFLRWTYLSKKNAVALGASELSHSPAWSVGYYFVPFTNLWMPYQALKEAFQASHPEFQQILEWISPPRLLALWWVLWLMSCFVNQGILRYSLHAKSLSELLHVSWAQLLSVSIDLPLLAVVWILVSTMQKWQTARSGSEHVKAPAIL